MADSSPLRSDEIPQEIDFLLFHSAGVHMAVEISQVEGIIGPAQAEQRGISFGMLNRILGTAGAASSARSKVLIFQDGDKTCGIGIDELNSILPIKIETIQPLPELLCSVAGVRPFWGAVPRGNEVVLLIDLFRLKSPISLPAETTA